MTERFTPSDGVLGYELRLNGHLDDHWSDGAAEVTMTHETDGTTTLCGPGLDQAALHGLLRHVRDLGATLISVTLLEGRHVHDLGVAPRRVRDEGTGP